MTNGNTADTLSLATMFILVIIIAGGVVAYIGDLLGRKMGKARLTLFGLRPRHTAILITTLTGLLIATSTIAVLLAASYPLRRILVHGTAIMRMNKTLETNNAYLEKRNDLLTEAQIDIKRQFEVNKAKTAEGQRLLASTQNKLGIAQAKEKVLASKITSQQKTLGVYEVRLSKEQQRLVVLLAEKDRADRATREARATLAATEKKAREVMARISDNARYNAATAGRLEDKFDALRHTHPIFSVGEELSRGIVKWSTNLDEISRQISVTLNKASTAAISRGAKPGKGGRAVYIESGPSISGKPRQMELEYIHALRDQIFLRGVPYVVQVICEANTLAGEPVAVKLLPTLNTLAFERGDVISCINLDGTKNAQDLATEFISFMATDVRAAAISHNIIPRMKAGGEDVYIEMDRAKPTEIVQQVKALGGRVSVCVKAADTTTSAGPLKLEFTVKAL